MAELKDHQAGTRIRERRLDLGLRQADLAKSLGISPSYLNLIEHNRRRIAGPLLHLAGTALNVDPLTLTQGADRALLNQLSAAAARADATPEVSRIEELAARYPGWTAVIAEQQARIAALELRVEELTDRMAHDPELATSLHAVISAVTSIRSTAAILTSDEKLDADWLRRFHKNIHDDAIRLAGSSDALVRYLDAPADQDVPLSPYDEAMQYLAAHQFHIKALETAKANPVRLAKDAGLGPQASDILTDLFTKARARARAMPLAEVSALLAEHGVAPNVIAAHFDVPLADALHRLADLPPQDDRPAMGLAVCDGAGAVTFHKPIPSFSLTHGGIACPLWPLFTAIAQPERPVQAVVALPGQQDDRFMCYAIATQSQGRFGVPPVITSTMLVVADPALSDTNVLPIGPACRICPRNDCAARREPSALGAIL